MSTMDVRYIASRQEPTRDFTYVAGVQFQLEARGAALLRIT
eukprot:SAG31_NODE_329_length_17643_cov_10.377793_6_plen_41_part_00